VFNGKIIVLVESSLKGSENVRHNECPRRLTPAEKVGEKEGEKKVNRQKKRKDMSIVSARNGTY
jgi:hypothetical protein